MNKFPNSKGKPVLLSMVKAIQENKDFLGEVDGRIGDGDHGANMNKGFSMFGARITEREISLTEGLNRLGKILFTEIGGSMGPIYGTIFSDMADAGEGYTEIGTEELKQMLKAGLDGLYDIVEARVGDKTLVDTLSPALDALERASGEGAELSAALESMKLAAHAGMESTRDLVAKFGRSSRLGERSRGVLDAGATSCCILLAAMADGMLFAMGC